MSKRAPKTPSSSGSSSASVAKAALKAKRAAKGPSLFIRSSIPSWETVTSWCAAEPSTVTCVVLLVAVTLLVHSPACFAKEFVMDDRPALQYNEDVHNDKAPLWQLMRNDFWGHPITGAHSHKSYRPLTVLAFRVNRRLNAMGLGGATSDMDPNGFKAANMILHAMQVVLVFQLCRVHVFFRTGAAAATAAAAAAVTAAGRNRRSLMAALLYAVHPLTTEPVAAIVGRADILSGIFFVLAILVYAGARAPEPWSLWRAVAAAALSAVAMLCKETGITAVLVCAALELCRCFYGTKSSWAGSSSSWAGPTPFSGRLAAFVGRIVPLAAGSIAAVYGRLAVMGGFDGQQGSGKSPEWDTLVNPAARSPHLSTRVLTYNYLVAANAGMLALPTALCVEWSAYYPLVESASDPRNLATLLVYALLAGLAAKALLQQDQAVTVALGIAAAAFLPASNLFFPVGFVLAERILYLPLAGFCVLAVHLALDPSPSAADSSNRGSKNNNNNNNNIKKTDGDGDGGGGKGDRRRQQREQRQQQPPTGMHPMALVVVVAVLGWYSVASSRRHPDWYDQTTLFKAGDAVNPLNPKWHLQYGNDAYKLKKFEKAAEHYERMRQLDPEGTVPYDQLGIVHLDLKQPGKAEDYFKRGLANAKDNKIAASKIHHNLAALYSQTNRQEEAYSHIELAYSYKPEDEGANMWMIRVQLMQKKWQRALDLAAAAVSKWPAQTEFKTMKREAEVGIEAEQATKNNIRVRVDKEGKKKEERKKPEGSDEQNKKKDKDKKKKKN